MFRSHGDVTVQFCGIETCASSFVHIKGALCAFTTDGIGFESSSRNTRNRCTTLEKRDDCAMEKDEILTNNLSVLTALLTVQNSQVDIAQQAKMFEAENPSSAGINITIYKMI